MSTNTKRAPPMPAYRIRRRIKERQAWVEAVQAIMDADSFAGDRSDCANRRSAGHGANVGGYVGCAKTAVRGGGDAYSGGAA